MRQLRHKYSAYLGVTPRDVLDHLMDQYGQIKSADLVENGMNYNNPMDISQPIDVGIRVWKAKDQGNQTWENFKKDFASKYDEIKEEQKVTAQAAGYTQANNAVQIRDALDNLANAAMADRRTVEDLSKANK
eukprot:12155123-Ditylum_brightwellii.AAC.1